MAGPARARSHPGAVPFPAEEDSDTEAAEAAGPAPEEKRTALAETLRAAIAVGEVVLAPETERRGCTEGWWQAVVLTLAQGEGETCTVCWLDDPEAGYRRRRRDELVPLHPMRQALHRKG